jgi:transcriptional regulator with XRE-family HTH domain
MNLAHRLKSLRVANLLSREELALLAKLSPQDIEKLETDENEIITLLSIRQLNILAVALKIEPKFLLGGECYGEPGYTPNALSEALRDFAADKKLTYMQLDECVGWELSQFMDNPEEIILSMPAAFIRDIGNILSIPWVNSVPKNLGA